MLQSKYTQATTFLGANMKKDKEAILVSYTFKKAVGSCFNQMSASKGIKIYGERAFAAMVKELTQLNNGAMEEKPVVVPIDAHLLSDRML